MQSDGDLFSLHRFVSMCLQWHLGLAQEGLRLFTLGPLRFLQDIPQEVQAVVSLLRLAKAIMCRRQERQVGGREPRSDFALIRSDGFFAIQCSSNYPEPAHLRRIPR
jgi:hypothetical protein